eukprot:GHVR01161103.1.p1 GENE.GHVR01161103.1~~GHVR01161103.1.p1  ORF type:complete len:292 (+),score=125.44 GHVR01161103.1:44-919(+)
MFDTPVGKRPALRHIMSGNEGNAAKHKSLTRKVLDYEAEHKLVLDRQITLKDVENSPILHAYKERSKLQKQIKRENMWRSPEKKRFVPSTSLFDKPKVVDNSKKPLHPSSIHPSNNPNNGVVKRRACVVSQMAKRPRQPSQTQVDVNVRHVDDSQGSQAATTLHCVNAYNNDKVAASTTTTTTTNGGGGGGGQGCAVSNSEAALPKGVEGGVCGGDVNTHKCEEGDNSDKENLTKRRKITEDVCVNNTHTHTHTHTDRNTHLLQLPLHTYTHTNNISSHTHTHTKDTLNIL